MSNKPSWKRNLRKVSAQIRERIQTFGTDTCIVSCPKQISLGAIQSGMFKHLGIHWDEDGIKFPDRVIPPSNMGTYSKRNREGYEIVYKDLPKVSRTWSINSPNYGDWEKGDHDVDFTKEVYQREFVAPKLLALRIEQLGEDVREQAHVFKFTVEEVLDRRSEDFEELLLFNLNILQENTGNHGVYESDASRDEYLKTLYVNWEILPPGDREETIARILSGIKSSDPKLRERLADRHEVLQKLKPKNFIQGTSEFRRYFGAQFADDLVVFENIEYGNAIYIMFGNWEHLSKKSRTELLSSKTQEFIRIPHTKTWKNRLINLVTEEVYKRKIGV